MFSLKRICFFLALVLLSVGSSADDRLTKVSNLVFGLKYREAVAELERVISNDPNNTTYYIVLIDLYFRLNEFELAEKNVRRALLLERNNPTLNSYLMEINRIKGNLGESKSIAERLLKLPDARTNKVFIVMYSRLLAEENPIEAEKFLERNVKVLQDYNLLTELARVQLTLGNMDKMKSVLDKALSLERLDKNIYSLYGEYYFRVGKYEEAIKSLEKAILFPGNKTREYYLLSQSYLNLRNYEKAFKFASEAGVREESLAKILFDAGKYSELVKRFRNSENEVIRYFIEESFIRLSPFQVSKDRLRLSKSRFDLSEELRLKGVPYYELYLRRAIRLNPFNYEAWFELGNYYRFYYSPYFAFEELKVAENLFVNDARMQDSFRSLGEYVSNSSKLSQWATKVRKQKEMKLLVEVTIPYFPVELCFLENAVLWALEGVKLINTVLTISFRGKGNPEYRKYDFVVDISAENVKEYMILKVSLVDPVTQNILTNATVSQRIQDNLVSGLYYNFRSVLVSLLPTYGVIEGIRENLLVARFYTKPPRIGDKVLVTASSLSEVVKGEYRKVAEGKVIDMEGEYALIDLDREFKYVTRVEVGYKVVKL